MSTAVHSPTKASYSVTEDAEGLVVACQYWRVRHARKHGGNITSVVFPYGSGKNIFTAPCSTKIRRGPPFRSLSYDNAVDDCPILSFSHTTDEITVESRSRLLDASGQPLAATCIHTFTYHVWGIIRQKVRLEFLEPVLDAWNVTIARPVVAPHLDEFNFRPAWQAATDWAATSLVGPWIKLTGGESFRDSLAAETGEIPLHLMFLQRGVEGFDWFCGENLEQWNERFAAIPHSGKFRVVYNNALGGYEVTLSPLDVWSHSFPLHGALDFDFFMGLPFVHEHVRPMLRAVGSSSVHGSSQPRLSFLPEERIRELSRHHGQIVRHHDDDPSPDGIYWRDGSYPPYPPPQMQAFDTCLAAMHAHDIAVTPYFSLHEYNPESPDFSRIGAACKRTIHDDERMISNHGPGGVFGVQMCLQSEWIDILKKNITTVLAGHTFAGLYFDWTFPLACRNKTHRPYTHWDVEGFMDVLAWARERVGPKGMLYMHASLSPFIMAENLATCVLVYESPAPEMPVRDLFPPIAEFMKTCSRLVLGTQTQNLDPRRFMLHCLLNHVTVDRPSDEFIAAYDELAAIDFCRFTRFANQSVSPALATHAQVVTAVYWNTNEALVLLANLGDVAADAHWQLDTNRLDWRTDSYHVVSGDGPSLAPLAFRYVHIVRHQISV